MIDPKDFNGELDCSSENQEKEKSLPETPIVIPLLIAGAFLGGMWSNKELRAVWKKAIIASALSGVINTAYGWILGAMKSNGGVTLNNTLVSAGASGLTGFLIVLIVYLSALGMVRYRRGRTLEPEE